MLNTQMTTKEATLCESGWWSVAAVVKWLPESGVVDQCSPINIGIYVDNTHIVVAMWH